MVVHPLVWISIQHVPTGGEEKVRALLQERHAPIIMEMETVENDSMSLVLRKADGVALALLAAQEGWDIERHD